MDEKRCERCGATFGCGAAAPGCWCEDVVVAPAALEALRTRFGDCLCPACLTAEAAASAPAPV